MPLEVLPCAVEPFALLGRLQPSRHAFALDGGNTASWGDGTALYAEQPLATLTVDATGRGRWHNGSTSVERHGSPWEQWQQFLDSASALLPARADRDAGGFVTVLAYDLKHWVENLPRRHAWPTGPVLFCAFYDWLYRYDYRRKEGWIHAQGQRQIDQVVARLTAPPRLGAPAIDSPGSIGAWATPRPLQAKEEYLRSAEAVLRYIAAGDVYQVNLAQPFRSVAGRRANPAGLFASLQQRYPMPFGAYVDLGDSIAVSHSPECFLTVTGDRVSTFPIKGTRAIASRAIGSRGAVRDRGNGSPPSAELRSDPKECAEHVMIVDLERNDLGRVCLPGSVEVAALEQVREFSFLAHMVSHVRGRLRPGVSLPDLLRATFPGGSITGAPKIRAMQIIEELEPFARGLYTGAIGWTDASGNSRFNLAIRTGVLERGVLTYWAGGGIVADSDPEREYEETLLKSRAFLQTLATPLEESCEEQALPSF